MQLVIRKKIAIVSALVAANKSGLVLLKSRAKIQYPWLPFSNLFCTVDLGIIIRIWQLCSGLEKSPFGAKSDFEIRAFKGFLYMYKKISPKKGLEVFTPKNLKWKKYIRQSENANGTPLEPLWGSK